MLSLSSLEPAFLHCEEHPILSMLPLRFLYLAKVRLSLTLILSHLTILVIWTDGSVPFAFGKDGFGVLANYSLCGTEITLSFSAGPLRSSFSAEACVSLHALCWSRQHQQVCHFSLTFALCSPPFSVFPFTSISLAGTIFSLLFY